MWMADGSGAATPILFKDFLSAAIDTNFDAACACPNRGFLAHIRAKNPGSEVQRQSCQPFRVDVGGVTLAFAHNGNISHGDDCRRLLSHLYAGIPEESKAAKHFAQETLCLDSGVLYAVYLDCYGRRREECAPSTSAARVLALSMSDTLDRVYQAVQHTQARGVSLLNIVVSDGENMVASRVAMEWSEEEARCTLASSDDPLQAIPASLYFSRHDTNNFLVASEPLHPSVSFDLVPPQHILLCTPGRGPSERWRVDLKGYSAPLTRRRRGAAPLHQPTTSKRPRRSLRSSPVC